LIFVLVHGAWDGAWIWRPVRPRLTAAGAQVFTPSMTGSAERVHLGGPTVGLSTYIRDVENVFMYEDLHGVILVGLSFGGMTVTGVADRIPERIAHLVYLDAFVPRDGQAFADLIKPETLARFEKQARFEGGGWAIPPPRDAGPRATPLPLRAVTERLTLRTAETDVPRTYIRCVLEPDGAFDDAAARARQEGWGYHELQSGHNPMQDVPDELTALLLRIGKEAQKP
jgi:pimeloyl-ACP methyl ester carboxylesterase